MKRRSLFLVGLAAVAVLAVIALAVFRPSPPFNSEDAAGAIGAVEKHRQQQIGDEDVILGDELDREAEQVVYAGYLNDAATLDNIQAGLANVVMQHRDGTDLANIRPALASSEDQLASHIEALQSRALANIRHSLASMDMVLQQRDALKGNVDIAALESFRAELASRISALENRPQLSSSEMAEFGVQLESFASQLANKFLASYGIDQMEAQLANINAQLSNREQIESSFLANAAIELQSMEQQLAVRSALADRFPAFMANEESFLAHRVNYLGTISDQLSALDNISAQLGSFIQALESHEQLADSSALANQISALESSVITLAGRASMLESRALANMDIHLQNRMIASRQLASISDSIALANRHLAQADQLENRVALQSFEQQLGSFEAQLSNDISALESRMLGSIEAQLGAIDRQLAQRAQLQSIMLEARGSDLQSRVIEQRQLAARAFPQYLSNLNTMLADSEILQNRQMAQNRVQLQSRISQLSNRADSLEPRFAQ